MKLEINYSGVEFNNREIYIIQSNYRQSLKETKVCFWFFANNHNCEITATDICRFKVKPRQGKAQ